MGNCQMLHETVVKDIIDVIDDFKNFDQVEWLKNKGNVGSIARRASNLVLVFPVLISNSLSIETASIISKAIERKCVNLLQILFSATQLTSVDNMYDYIKQFHTNLDAGPELTLDNFMTVMDYMANEGAITITDREAYDAVMEDMRNINYTLETAFNPVSVNNYKISRNIYGESVVVLEAPNGRVVDRARGKTYNYISMDGDAMDKLLKGSSSAPKMYDNKDNLKDRITYHDKQLTQNEINKANELVPTTMLVNFTTVNNDGIKVDTVTGVVGIKAKLYPVDSMDIINRLASKVKDRNGLFNLIRASTREISFFRDLAFAIDKAKLDGINMAKESNNARMFKVLERRAAKNRFSALIKKNNASPITSLVISKDEVEFLKKYNNLDIEKSHNTRTLLEAFNLMDIVIADESLEIARFMFDDGDGVFETLPFDDLEKQARDNSYKKVVNLMSKINR